MPSDLATIETVTVGDYEVRIGQAGDEYEATVASADTDTADGPPRGLTPAHMLFGAAPTPDTDDTNDADPAVAPVVQAPHYWVAAGLAVEAYERAERGRDTDVHDDLVTDMDVTDADGVDADAIIEDLGLGGDS